MKQSLCRTFALFLSDYAVVPCLGIEVGVREIKQVISVIFISPSNKTIGFTSDVDL